MNDTMSYKVCIGVDDGVGETAVSDGRPAAFYGYCVLVDPSSGFNVYDGTSAGSADAVMYYRTGTSKFVTFNPPMVLKDGITYVSTETDKSVAIFYKVIA